ncbi:MAG: hypothetical protein FGM27_07925 [Candidatus Omnitrophica bacterium]|nr:hypothetical protein [Candidatus Omnitrophota bacterium]
MIFRKKKGPFDPAEWEWQAASEELIETTPAGAQRRLPWSEISEIRLVFSPTHAKPWRHYFQMKKRGGGLPFEIDNTGCGGVENFCDLSRYYSPFVRASLERIRAMAPDAEVRSGLTPGVYAAGLTAMISSTVLLTYAVAGLRMEWGPPLLMAGVKFLMVAIASPCFILWAIQTRPRKRSLREPLENDLPI